MGAVDPEVFHGRNPWWREALEQNLHPEERRKVRTAVNWGRRVEERHLVPYVYGLIAIVRRSLGWRIPLFAASVVHAAVWVYVSCFRGFGPCSFWLPFGGVVSLIGTAGLLFQIRSLRKADELNTRTA